VPRAGWRIIAALTLCAVAGAAGARPSSRREREKKMPLRVVIQQGQSPVANCVFSTVELPATAPYTAPQRNSFDAGEPIWGRCFLPARPGPSRPGDLVDAVTVDGRPAWEQAYDHALPADALARLTPYGEVLRTLFAGLKPGAHRVEIVGRMKRGGRTVTLYRGAFRYVR
jgi:hypothetical protein